MEENDWEFVKTSDLEAPSEILKISADEDNQTELSKSVTFKINFRTYSVTSSVSPHLLLIDFIRDNVKAKGTKVLCREGGCGACTVVVTVPDPSVDQGATRTFSVNACQVLVYACSDWEIETIENLGNRFHGYHPIQKSLVGMYGTQCGYCSPGMVMSMYGKLKENGDLTNAEVERALDGNICRCTGYRPIMDAFKAFASDAPGELKQRLVDIEDAYKCSGKGESCIRLCGKGSCSAVKKAIPVFIQADSVQWYEPTSLNGLCSVISKSSKTKYTLVAGNTGTSVFKKDGPFTRYISLSRVPELHRISATAEPLVFGGRVSLSSCIDVFKRVSATGATGLKGYRHLNEIAEHWKLVANLAVRNSGSWAGNLMMRHKHREFPSDIFITLAACGAVLTLKNVTSKEETTISVMDMDNQDFNDKIILSMSVPAIHEGVFIRTYKVGRRAANSHAYVSAAIRFPVDESDSYMVTDTPGLYFAGISPDFVSALRTADHLKNKKLSDSSVVAEALRTLGGEVTPTAEGSHPGSVDYRKALALALFYKTVIWIMRDYASPEIKSAGEKLVRGLSHGQQVFLENKDNWPLGQPIPKIESNAQVSGEAEYADDQIPATEELHGAFVQSTYANAKIDSIDATDALALDGVIEFFMAKDVVGHNSFVLKSSGNEDDKIFATERVQYAGQSLGLVVAKSRLIAVEGAKLVKVTYSDIKTPVLTIKEAIKQGKVEWEHPEKKEASLKLIDDVENQKSKPSHVTNVETGNTQQLNTITGEIEIGSQFHFMMEPLCARVVPIEDGYNVTCTTQHMNMTQSVVAQVLNIPANQINMEVRRIGGGFGGKITRANLLACAAAVAVSKLKTPVRITIDLETHMTLVGWRDPFYATYKIDFDDQGTFNDVTVDIYADAGFVKNDSSAFNAKVFIKNVYNSGEWHLTANTVTTDTAANTWCRTPGNTQGIAIIENIVEHVASHLKKYPLEIREINLFNKKENITNKFKTDILPLLKQKSNISERQNAIVQFNKDNRWRKRGLSLIPFYYPFNFPRSFRYTTQVIIYEHDGSVAITHGGIEMGQGINTKAAQVAAHVLGVPLSSISVKPSSNIASANSMVTGGSYGSDLIAYGVWKCCEPLIKRINEVKDMLPSPDPDWTSVIKACLQKNVDLCERYWTDSFATQDESYNIWGGCVLEVELDVLTGQYITPRVDIVEDVGHSMSPFVDIGQVEGAFVMGMGLFTSEEVFFNKETGQKLTNNSWEYKLPTALDIPEDFRVTFLPNAATDGGILGSKATGEPPFCLTYSIVTALRQAITAARADGGVTGWFPIATPLTVEKVQQLCYVKPIDKMV